MSLSRFAVSRPVTIIVLVVIVLLLGAVSLNSLTLDLFPDMSLPMAVVLTDYEGAGPKEVEKMVTRPLEEVLGTVGNVEEISSTSRMDSSLVMVNFNWGTDMDFALLEIREKIDLLRNSLPDDAGKPLVFKMDPSLMPIIQVGISGNQSLEEIKELAEEEIKPRLERIAGVASVNIHGGRTKEIQVRVDPAALSNYELGLGDVVQALRSENLSLSGGRMETGMQELMVRVTGEFNSLDEIRELPLPAGGGAVVQIQDVAVVQEGFKDIDQYAYMNGKPSVGLTVQKQTDANTVLVAKGVKEILQNLSHELPGDLEFATVMDQSDYIMQSLSSVVRNIVIGGFLALLVLYLFLRNLRSTLVIALAMPISLIGTFTLIYFAGMSLNMMTLGGLALGIGMMVDSSVVVLENIFRYREEGHTLMEAAEKGSMEMTNAVTASTLTTVCVFLPVVFVEGLASILFKPLAFTVSFSLLVSLLVALTLIPMLSSRMLKVRNKALTARDAASTSLAGYKNRAFIFVEQALQRLDEKYRMLLQRSLNRRRLVVVIAALAIVISLALVPFVGVEFVPTMDEGMLMIDVTLPYGASLEQTKKVVTSVEEIVSKRPEVQTIFTEVGTEGSGMGLGLTSPEEGHLDVRLVDKRKRDKASEEVAEELRSQFASIPGAEIQVEVSDAAMGGPMAGAPVQVNILGDDLDVLRSLGEKVVAEVREVKGTRQVEMSMEEGRPEINVIIDREKASGYGIGAAQVARAVRSGVQGEVATYYRTGGDEYDLRVMLQESGSSNLQELRNLVLRSPAGYEVFLGDIAEFKVAEGPVAIERENQSRKVSVTSDLVGRDLGSVTKDIEARVSKIEIPSGYTVEYGGESKEMAEAFGNLTLALLLAIALVYLVMAAGFESLVHPFVIMFSLPATVVGVVLSLVITGFTFSVVTFIGVIMLGGIVVNNAIVLVDYINQLRRKGMEREEAILKAGPRRLRPILMTTLTTILAMLPLALFTGEGGEANAPMATVVIGGLITSTLLTLVLVPVIYTIVDDWGKGIARRLLRKREPEASEVPLTGED